MGLSIDDAPDVQARDAAGGVLGGLALGVGRRRDEDGDDRLGDGLAQIGPGVRLQLADQRRSPGAYRPLPSMFTL